MSIGGALRNIIHPFLGRRLLSFSLPLSHVIHPSPPIPPTSSIRPIYSPGSFGSSCFSRYFSVSAGASFTGLTDSRYPKRRPGTKPRRKRASLKPPGPYAWVQYVPGEPIPRSRPNEGSVQGRNRIKRIKQRKAFILSEKKKRKAQMAEARKRKEMKQIERKMAQVAREKAWAERLVELQQLEEAKKAAMS